MTERNDNEKHVPKTLAELVKTIATLRGALYGLVQALEREEDYGGLWGHDSDVIDAKLALRETDGVGGGIDWNGDLVDQAVRFEKAELYDKASAYLVLAGFGSGEGHEASVLEMIERALSFRSTIQAQLEEALRHLGVNNDWIVELRDGRLEEFCDWFEVDTAQPSQDPPPPPGPSERDTAYVHCASCDQRAPRPGIRIPLGWGIGGNRSSCVLCPRCRKWDNEDASQ